MSARHLHHHPQSSEALAFFRSLVPIHSDGPDGIAARRQPLGRRSLRTWALGVCVWLLLMGWPVRVASQTAVATVAAGTFPFGAAVNPVTNMIYVTNENDNNVTVIDGATDNTTTLAAGTNPHSVNPTTNQIYVTNSQGSDVTVLNEVVDPDRRCPSDYLHQSRVTR